MIHAQRILVGKLEERDHLEGDMCSYGDNIKMAITLVLLRNELI